MRRPPLRTRAQIGRGALPHVVLVASLLLTAAAAGVVSQTQRARDRGRFTNAVEATRDRVEGRLETYIALLRGTASFVAVSDTVTRAEFAEYVRRLAVAARYPGIQGIGLSMRVQPRDVAAFERAASEGGIGSFRIWPDTARAEYHTILYLEPLDRRNRAAIGYDMFTDETRRIAMARARDTGVPALTGRVTLVQELEDARKQPGFLVYLPVYRKGASVGTVEARRAALRGFVYAPFRADDLFAGVFGTERQPRVHFRVYDGESTDSLALLYVSRPAAARRGAYVDTVPLAIAGRRWTVVFESTPYFMTVVQSLLLPLVIGGMLVAVALFLVTRSQVRAQDVAERTADELREALHDRDRLIRESQRARLEAEEANRLKSQFLANMSHEIRTPINAVTGYTQLLEMEIGGALTPTQRAHVERIRLSSQHLLSLVNDVLDLSKVEAGEMEVDAQHVPVSDSAAAAVAMVEPLARGKGLALSLEMDCDPHTRYVGDEDRVRQILVNLLGNAVKFTPRGAVTMHCRVTESPDRRAHVTQGSSSWVAIEVRDTGIGIDPDRVEAIFEPFVQVEGGYTRKQGGTGLGLSISRRLARLMGGDVTVASQPGAGSRFTLWLPAA